MSYRLYARSVCDMNSTAAAVVRGFWHYTSVLCLLLTDFHLDDLSEFFAEEMRAL